MDDIPTQIRPSTHSDASRAASAAGMMTSPRSDSSSAAPLPSQVVADLPSQPPPVQKGNATPSPSDYRHITLNNGESATIPETLASWREKSLHVQPQQSSTVPRTSGYFRFLSPFFTARYTALGAIRMAFGVDAVNEKLSSSTPLGTLMRPFNRWLNGLTQKRMDPIDNVIEEFRDKTELPSPDELTEGTAQQATGQLKAAGYVHHPGQKLRDLISKAQAEEQHNQHITRLQQDFASKERLDGEDANTLINHMTSTEQAGQSQTSLDQELNSLQEKFKQTQQGIAFDSLLGIGSLAITGIYANQVLHDIHMMYAETVAYELGKTPEDVSKADLFFSDNRIVQDTRNNYLQKNALRLATDGLFFGRMAGKLGMPELQSVPFGDIMLGVKGGLLLMETQRKETSIFKDISTLSEEKLTVEKGLGTPITPSDLFDLYQKYQKIYHPDKQFNDATRHDDKDKVAYHQSATVFSRMAELMNITYQYKHRIDKDQDQVDSIKEQMLGRQRYFTLPKFLYLLGHDMVSADKPLETLAYTEIANNFSIDATRRVAQHIKNGETLAEALTNTDTPVDFTKVFREDQLDPELLAISQRAKAVDEYLLREQLALDPEHLSLYKEAIEDKYHLHHQPDPNLKREELERFHHSPPDSFIPSTEQLVAASLSHSEQELTTSDTLSHTLPDSIVTQAAAQERLQDADLHINRGR